MIDAAQLLLPATKKGAIAIHVVAAADWPGAAPLRGLPPQARQWAAAQGFAAKPGSFVTVPDGKGGIAAVLAGAPRPEDDPFLLGALSSRLPPGTYGFARTPAQPQLVALGWCLELYRYDPFRSLADALASGKLARLACPAGVDHSETLRLANSSFMVRDLINTPANLLGPAELEAAARRVAKAHGARYRVVSGKALAQGFPLIAAVGAASSRPPLLIDFTWGNPRHPKVTLVGKGVCFDTGGLDIKPSANMLLMKKDMGGAANVLGLASLIMAAKLRLRLRVLIPAVENAISGPAFRPGDVFTSRKGLTVEIGNTDAEGRLILADALALGAEEKPALMIDMATLTGAARVALGPDLPPIFTDDDAMAAALLAQATQVNDPLWRLPLWRPYGSTIETPIADLNNSGAGGYAGSITAALFLRRFAEGAGVHVHLDIFGWTPNAKPARPKGGEQQGMRAIYALLKDRYGG